jgi:hypothetical protein
MCVMKVGTFTRPEDKPLVRAGIAERASRRDGTARRRVGGRLTLRQ